MWHIILPVLTGIGVAAGLIISSAYLAYLPDKFRQVKAIAKLDPYAELNASYSEDARAWESQLEKEVGKAYKYIADPGLKERERAIVIAESETYHRHILSMMNSYETGRNAQLQNQQFTQQQLMAQLGQAGQLGQSNPYTQANLDQQRGRGQEPLLDMLGKPWWGGH